MKPVPRRVAEGEYPDTIQHPLLRLRANCLAGWHKVIVGTPFRFSDENINLNNAKSVTYEQWDRWTFENKVGWGFKRKVKLFCVKCNKVTDHIPIGVVEGS